MFTPELVQELEQKAISLSAEHRQEALQAIWKEHGRNSQSALEDLPTGVRNNLGFK